MPTNLSTLSRTVIPWLAWAILILLAWLAYAPGLTGGFLFDDFVNLPALGAMGPVDDSQTFWRYITSGTADPTGRPLSLLTFLLDARDWPADPAPFLRTNLLLHLLNGSLLLLLLRRLGHALGTDVPRNFLAALIGAGLWLLHPLFVSTTLYIVQREAMLPATFMLCGLLAYDHGRSVFGQTGASRGLAWMAIGIVGGTLLATLSKANGLLLPLLAWVLEASVYRQPLSGPQDTRSANRFKAAFLILPSILILAYLLSFAVRWNQVARGWTIGQRMLTEPRVLLDYLNLLVVPRSVSTGLYNDDYIASTDVWHPLITLPASLLIFTLIAAALHWRRRAPALCAAVLFYFAGHVLESSVVPLELYFEHRNYVPALLLFWPLGLAISSMNRPWTLRLALASALLLLFALTTYHRSQTWGNPRQLSSLWASRNPDSSRAQATAATEEVQAGKPKQAMRRLGPIWAKRPGDLQIALNYINAACAAGGVSPADKSRLADTLLRADIGTLLVRQWLENALHTARTGRCPGLDMDAMEGWLRAAQQNPAINTPLAQEKSMPPLLALVALEKRDPDAALAWFDRALAANISPDTAAGQVSVLASSGYYTHALAHLDTYERLMAGAPKPRPGMPYVHEWVLVRQDYWPRELSLLREKLKAEIESEGASPEARVP